MHIFLYYYYYGNSPVSKKEYEASKKEYEKLLIEITKLKAEISEKEPRFKLLDSVFNPKITIIEVNNKSMGHRYTGKFRMISEFGEKKEFVISMGKVENFNGKDDPKLLELAKQRALEKIKKKLPHIFT